ncbi:MAG: type VI secretion system contractile sheath large subunit [Holosporales bacterium]|jgi:type VI secretion system protein ImpC|nr:type VI secretion system contractile sheath large subunit [Holosporales bacterium]
MASPSIDSQGLLDRLFQEGKLARTPDLEPAAEAMLTELLDRIDAVQSPLPATAFSFINQEIQQTDTSIGAQLNEVLHHPDFLALEGSWRSLHYLVMNSETGTSLKLRVANVSKTELLEDLEKAVEFDQSALFKKVYEEEYGTFGGTPYSCLIGGYEFTRSTPDMELLFKVSSVAAAAHTPFIAMASSALFDMDSYTHLAEPRDLSKVFESSEMVKWRSFRESEDSRYVVLTLPHILARLPYGPDTQPVEGLAFAEDLYGTENAKFCWGNPAFALAQRITNAVAHYGWPAAIRGVEGGGLVTGLPAYAFKTTDGDVALKCPTEVAVTDRREKELGDLGFLSLCHCKGTDYAAFFGGQTTQKSQTYNTDEANANASLSARLPCILAASRFAHYIKAIVRDKIGSFSNKGEVEHYLNTWVAGYVILNDGASQTLKARYPLREARVDVSDVPGKPGSYTATIYLRPHFQLETLTASIRLVASLPAPAK